MTVPRPSRARASHRFVVPSLMALLSGMSAVSAAEAAPAPAPKPAPAPSATAPAATAPVTQGEPVTVVGDRDRDGYKVDQAPSVLRTPQPLKDTPQSVQVIPKELLRAKGSTSLQDAMRSVPGAALGSGEGSSTGDRLYLRGFLVNNDIYVDGMRDSSLYLRDTFNTQQVEVLKGPSSAMFGRGATGGAVNLVTNKPSDTWTGDAALTYGTYANKRTEIGVGGPVLDDGLLNLRLDDMMQSSDSFRDDVHLNRWGVAPSVSSRFGGFDVLLQYFHQKEDSTYDSGMATYQGRPTDVPVSSFYGFKDDDFQQYDISKYTATIGYRFNEGWTARNQTRYSDDARDLRATTLSTPLTAAQQLNMNRSQTLRHNRLKSLDNITEGQYLGKIAGRPFSALAGMELIRETSDNLGKNSGSVPAISVFHPETSPSTVGAGRANDFTGALAANTFAVARTAGVYGFVTYELIDHLTAVVGVRFDNFKTEVDDRNPSNVDAERTDHYVTTHDGLVYAFTPQVSVYASFGTAVNPSAESLALNGATAELEPERTRSFELGIKGETPDDELGGSFAVFRTDKYNQRTGTAPNQTVDGQTRVDGAEVAVNGKPAERVSIYGGVALLKGVVLESDNVGTSNVDPTLTGIPVEGSEPIGTPRLSGSLWVNVDLSHGFSAGTGFYAVSRRYGDAINTTVIPGYTRFDAAAAYRRHIGSVDGYLQLNVFNLSNITYYDGDRNRFVTPGAPISGQLTAGVEF